MTDYDAAARRLQAVLDAPPLSRQRVDLNDVRTLLAEHFELQSRGHRVCVWPECLTGAQQLELSENVHRSMLGEDTGPDPVPDCNCPERLRAELPRITDGITGDEAYASATLDLTIDEIRSRVAGYDAATARAERAEAALAELRERLGKASEQWGVRMRDDDPDEDIEVMSSEAQARECATAWRDEVPDANPTAMVRTCHDPGPWRNADAAPRTALERAAEEQGSTRDQLERMLTDEGRRKVEEFMAETAGQSDDIDIDEVIARNHRDAARDWGIADA